MARPTTTVRRELGAELRRLRRDRRGAQVAAALGWSESKLSRIETARIGIRESDLDRLLDLYAVGADERTRLRALARGGRARVWWTPYRSSVPERYDEYVALEAEAELMSEWEPQVVPGLLQTDEYAGAVIAPGADVGDPAVAQQRLALRMARQAILARVPAPRLCVVLDESVLRRVVGGPGVLRRQLDRLLDTSSRPGIELLVLPFSAGAHAALAGAFVILEFGPGRSPVAHVEGLTGGELRTRPDEVEIYRTAFADLRRRALPAAESQELIARTGDDLR